MIAFEFAFIFLASLVLIVSIAAVGRPLAEAYAEKLKTKYREIGSQEAQNLKNRLNLLEGEILELKSHLKILQDNNEYVSKIIESSPGKTKRSDN